MVGSWCAVRVGDCHVVDDAVVDTIAEADRVGFHELGSSVYQGHVVDLGSLSASVDVDRVEVDVADRQVLYLGVQLVGPDAVRHGVTASGIVHAQSLQNHRIAAVAVASKGDVVLLNVESVRQVVGAWSQEDDGVR